MPQIEDSLKKLGLTQTEALLYSTALKYSSVGVNDLMKQTQINRTTIYHALGTLEEKGLLAKKGTGTKMLFSATNPERIENLLNEKISLLEKQRKDVTDLIPLLKQSISKTAGKINVYHYEGIEGIKLVIEDALYCKSGHWDIIAPVKNFFSEFDKKYADYFIETRHERNLTSRSLWEYKEDQKLMTPQQIKERNPRILPKVMHGKFQSVINIYDDKIIYISSMKELSAVLIQSQEVHDTMLAVFEGLWSVSTPLNK